MIEARRKQILRDISMLEMVNLAMSGGKRASQALKDLMDEYYVLEGIDRKREEIEANWESIRQ